MIILNKRKKSWEMYPIGSPKGALNTKRVPEFIGVLKFSETEKGMDIKRFVVKDDIEEKLYPPSKAISFLRSQAVFLAQKDEELESFLNANNISVRYANICQHCSYEGTVTIINSSYSYTYHDQLICKECAEDTIKRELQLRGYNKKVFRNFKKVLEKTGNLDEVLKMLSPRFDPIKNSDLTLFDKVEVHDRKIPRIATKRLKIPENFKKIIIKNNNEYLLPVQYLAVRAGVLRGENTLVVSATGSGKTLIGELAGVPKAMKGEKFLFLTPLVALANQKYREFKRKYEALGLKVAIKVGGNRIKAKGELNLPDSNIANADIVVGTYEGIDFLIRSGKSHLLDNLGLVLIDEIHTISDEERGLRLNGLIKRIRHLFPNTQIIGLSATILIRKLVNQEFYNKSSKGYNGQSLIFTNSRRKTHKLANFLSNKGINAAAYHAGLSYSKKERIEKNFAKGKITAVVTTAALAAGVDFPASQVIFESLIMGNKWITPNEFSQMLGRAGRPSYHDRGLVYLIPEIANEFDGESEEAVALDLLESDVENIYVDYTEEGSLEQILADITSKSLNNIEEVEEFYQNIPVPIDLNAALDELDDKKAIHISADGTIRNTKFGRAVSMSFISVDDGVVIKNSIENPHYLSQYYKKPFFKNALKDLHKLSNKIDKQNRKNRQKNRNNDSKKGSKKQKQTNNNSKKQKKNSTKNQKLSKKNESIKIKNANNIFKGIHEKMTKDEVNANALLKVQSIALDLELFENAYLAPAVHKQIISALKMNFSTRLFSESTLDIISSGEAIAKLDKKFQEALLKIQIDFLRCDCAERPFCECLQRGISYFILNQRLDRKDPIDISKSLMSEYQIQAYPGDIFAWLDTYVRNLDAIKRVARAYNNKEIIKEADKLIKIIEKGK